MFRKLFITTNKNRFSKQFNSRTFSNSNRYSSNSSSSSKSYSSNHWSYQQQNTSNHDDGYDFNNILPIASNTLLQNIQNDEDQIPKQLPLEPTEIPKSIEPVEAPKSEPLKPTQPEPVEPKFKPVEPSKVDPVKTSEIAKPPIPVLEIPKLPEIPIEPIAAEFQPTFPVPKLNTIPSYHSEVSDIYNKIKDATCMVRIYSNARCISHGSGCFIESEGVAVTAAHVVGSQKTVFVATRDQPDIMLTATVVLVDQLSDIAIIKINKPRGEIDPEPFKFPTVKLAPRDYKIKEGDFCMAVGAPQSQKYYGTVSTGIINCVPRKLGNLSEKIVIQHTAMNGGGLSGGPLLNENGELIGVHIMGTKTGGTTFGFAARLSDLYYLYDDYKHKTSKYMLGIDYTEHDYVNGNGKKFWVVANSQRKELKKGDRILEVAGVACDKYNTLAGVIRESIYRGNVIKFKVERVVVEDGKTIKKIEEINVQPMKKPIKI